MQLCASIMKGCVCMYVHVCVCIYHILILFLLLLLVIMFIISQQHQAYFLVTASVVFLKLQ